MSLEPEKYIFVIRPGADFYKRIIYKVGGSIQPLTDYEASLIIKDKLDGTVLMTLDTTSNGGISLGGDAGTIDLVIPKAVTSTLTWTTGFYELFLTEGDGRTDVLLYGGFKVRPF
jgi:hypothetical protein